MADLLDDNDQVVTKGRFAEIINVSAGRVSQMIAAGQISGDALVGEGRAARIDVALAKEQLRRTIDPAQRFGANGIGTRLASAATSPAPGLREPSASDLVDEQIRQEKLRQIQLANERADEAAAARRGLYVEAAEARRETGRIAGRMLNLFEGGLADIASALAAKFELPQRDVLHLLRHEFRGLRQRAADQARAEASGLPHLVEDLSADDRD